MRILIIAMSLLLYTAIEANAQVSVSIGSHGVSIGFNVSSYPRLVAIPGYPVYYDPRADSNYFFYDGLYWVYQDDNWYSSAWYDGPWDLIGPEDVPLFVLRVPVRYYRHRPTYFSGWSLSLAPRWGEHWGHDWEQRRHGWDKWNRHSVPHAAPLPDYQRQYSGSRYPHEVEQQNSIQTRSYRYQPREAITKQYFQQHAAPVGARTDTRQQTQAQQQVNAKDQAKVEQQKRDQAQAQQQKRTQDQAQMQQQQKQQAQMQQQQKKRTEDQAQAQQQQKQQAQVQQQQHAQDQAHAQQQKRAQDQAQAKEQEQQKRNEDKAQAQQQQQVHAKDQAQMQQQKHAQDQAQAQQQKAEQQSRGRDQAQVQQQKAQQQQQARGKDQAQPQQQRGQQQAPAPKANQQQQQKKEKDEKKDDKKDGGGQDGH